MTDVLFPLNSEKQKVLKLNINVNVLDTIILVNTLCVIRYEEAYKLL